MRIFFKIISYTFHPLFVPLAGTLAYFKVTPKYSPVALRSGNILPIFILTVIIPIITFFILRNIGAVNTVFMPTIKERKYPLYIHIIVLLMVVYKVIPNHHTLELHFFFLGLIIAAMTALLLLFLKSKASMHLMGMGSLFMFLIGLSIHFELNITLAISLLTVATGLVATSRLYLKAHSKAELLIGFIVGALSQLLLVKFWL
jgi:membrane-associated phospholipid phosphatase